MKIMVFANGHEPAQKYGGPITSLSNFVYNLGDSYDIDIVCSDHDLGDPTPLPGIKPGFNQVGKAQVMYISDSERTFKNFDTIIKMRKPDCLYLSSIFSARLNVPLLKIAKRDKLKVVYAPRGELLDNAIHLKFFKKLVFLILMRLGGLYKGIYFHATSDAEKLGTMKWLGIPEEKIFMVGEFPSLPPFKPDRDKKAGFLKIASISRIHKSKNLVEAIKSVLNLSGNVTFDIYGPIEHEDYWSECEKLIATAPENVKINYCGAIEMGRAKSVFSKYDCFLFPTISENYSHSIAEAVLAGTIPVISRGTTPWDDIDSNGGYTLPLHDISAFTDVLQLLCRMDSDEYSVLTDKLCDYRKTKLDAKALFENYRMMFNEVLEK
ncbi:MAG: glycosyltransferase [Clostridia bacterium]|nr:glycosyltransferase [Clostridia bacterium]